MEYGIELRNLFGIAFDLEKETKSSEEYSTRIKMTSAPTTKNQLLIINY